MNYTLFFLLCASAILILSTVSICVAPIINGFLGSSVAPIINGFLGSSGDKSWGTNNCQLLSDEYDYDKSQNPEPDKQKQKELDKKKREIGTCKREKAIYGLEYSSFICDIILGGICAILGLLHYLDIGKSIEKKTGLIGIIAGTIGFIITFIYIIFSGYIFTHDRPGLGKLFPNKAYLKWNGYKYVPPYDLEKYEDNEDIALVTYSELGQKQYNYDSDILKEYPEYTNCQADNYDTFTVKRNYNSQAINEKCNYIWKTGTVNETIMPKYIYDRWITTIILGVFIFVLNIGLILFGFFLFKNLGESNTGSIPLPKSSTNALE